MVALQEMGRDGFPEIWSHAKAWVLRSLENSAAPMASSLFGPRSTISAKR